MRGKAGVRVGRWEGGGVAMLVAHLVAFLEAACLHTWNTLVLIDHLDMIVYGTAHNTQGIIHLPAPISPNCSKPYPNGCCLHASAGPHMPGPHALALFLIDSECIVPGLLSRQRVEHAGVLKLCVQCIQLCCSWLPVPKNYMHTCHA